MIFESDTFKTVKDYNKTYKDFKNKIKSGLNISNDLDFNLTSRLYTLYGFFNGQYLPLVNGSIDHQKNIIKNRTKFTDYKLISYDLNLNKGAK